MSTAPLETDGVRDGVADVPLIVGDLPCQIEDLRTTGGDAAVIAELWAPLCSAGPPTTISPRGSSTSPTRKASRSSSARASCVHHGRGGAVMGT